MANRYSSLSLRDVVCLCAGPCDDDAWEEFVSRVDKPIGLTVMRTAWVCGERSLSLIEDLRQETYVKLLKDGCHHLRDFAIKNSDLAILRYIKKAAINVTFDHFKRKRRQKEGGDKPHISLSEVDLEAGKQVPRSQERIDVVVLLGEINELLNHFLTGPDKKRDRMIFWLYFRQGWSTNEIASPPTIGLNAKGVGSVIERLTRCLREQILRSRMDSEDDKK